MAKKKDSLGTKIRFWNDIRNETVQAILAIFSFALALLFILASFGKAGTIGFYLFSWLTSLFGLGYYLVPITLIMLAFAFLRGVEQKFKTSKIVGSIIFFLSGLALIHIISANAGGVIGRWAAYPLVRFLDVWVAIVILAALIIASVMIILETHITLESLAFWRLFSRKDASKAKRKGSDDSESDIDEREEAAIDRAVASAAGGIENEGAGSDGQEGAKGKTARELAEAEAQKTKDELAKSSKRSKLAFTDEEESGFAKAVAIPQLKPYDPPPLSLLEKDKGKPETGDIKANANIIKRTLQNFNITVEMDEVSIGPSVTRYALKPAEGVKLSRIIGLNNDLALALAAHPIRIEAPIPGKSLVGIEVPNTAKTTVGLATLLASADYQESDKPILVSLGKDIAGRAHFSNLAKAPHMLIAGATGSGKSVTIHALITSLLYRNSPENLKFIMIDPKRVELTLYNKIPHLLTPVITDPKKAILALKWAAKEMSRRYDILEKNTVRDVQSYHKSILGPAMESYAKNGKKEEDAATLPETMPYIVVVIDELADIMQTYPRELESAIVRLAQMSRAVGIHLVLSTQRPSVNVITGLIKANVPTRVALQVASQIDSRTILDQQGAEKLLGAGDMLYLGGEMSKPVRLQSAYISETEVKKVVKYLIDQYKDEIASDISLVTPEAGSNAAFDAMSGALDGSSLEDDDDMYESAREAVVSAGKASTSYIQRKLGVGYSRAAKLMDMLEERGVIGPANGSKPREVMGAGDTGVGPGAGMDGASSEGADGGAF